MNTPPAALRVDHDQARAAFVEQLDVLAGIANRLTGLELMAASHCTGWTVADVLVHVHMGLQEMLLGLVTPTGDEPGSDAATYWRTQPPGNDGEADELAGLRFVRLVAAAYRRPAGLVGHLNPTVDGVRTAATALPPGAVRFQGQILSTGDFLATWAVELAVHHLDLTRELTLPPPAAAAAALGRRTIEALNGAALPATWTDETVLLLGTGRQRPTPAQQPAAARLPVLG